MDDASVLRVDDRGCLAQANHAGRDGEGLSPGAPRLESMMPRWLDWRLLLVACVWGTNFAVLKDAYARMEPLALNAARFVPAVALLGLVAARRRLLWPVDGWDRGLVLRVVGLGLLGTLLYQTLFALGLARTTAGNSALLLASSPLWTALIAHGLGVEALSRRAAGGLLLAFGGVAVIVAGGQGADLSGATLTGDLLIVAAAICWGAYTACSRDLLRRLSATGLVFWSICAGLPGLWWLGAPGVAAAPLATDGWLWAAIAYSGCLSIGLAYAIWNRSVAQVGPSLTAVYVNLVPVVALLTGWLALGEQIVAVQLLGGVLVLGGVRLTRARRGRPDG